MDESLQELIEAIHATPVMIVLVTTGGGATAISDLLAVPGASGTILEATVPYARTALETWLAASDGGSDPEAALDIATQAWHRALELADAGTEVYGVACTAALATLRERRGADRAHLAAVGDGVVLTDHVRLERSDGRGAQERHVSNALIGLVAKACGA